MWCAGEPAHTVRLPVQTLRQPLQAQLVARHTRGGTPGASFAGSLTAGETRHLTVWAARKREAAHVDPSPSKPLTAAPEATTLESVLARKLLFSTSLLAAQACGAAAPAPPRVPRSDGCEAPHPEEGHSLEVYLSVLRDAQKQPLCPGQHLRASDELWVDVELDTASHVRLVFVAADGEAGELLRQDQADLTRVAMFRAPEGLLSRAAGEAQLVIVASREPLSSSDPMMGSIFDLSRDQGTLVERDGSVRPPPPGSGPSLDGVSLDLGAEGLHADFDARGLAMLTIPVRAAPP